MNIRKVASDIAVSDQLGPKDLPLVRSLGYRSVVCNRPDGESGDQPLFESVQTAADLSDIATRYLPIVSGAPTPDAIDEMRILIRELPKPILLYCRSGARSAMLVEAALAGRSDQ